ncbi:MAG: YhgE/Pip domain-containing protein [Microbacteriaceae bacterium]|nr:YhgE/Pip domain-containing protein [Microbacteriaceae bacterium]
MNSLTSRLKSLRRNSTWLRRLGVLAVVVIPLAFTGLFVGALSNVDKSLDRIPAAVVNNDSVLYTTGANGESTPVFAGRQLVTELTASTEAFNWKVTNSEDAARALKRGEVYAVLTIPADFSKSILSLGGPNPTRGEISIKTDDSHSYLTGTLAESVGRALASSFGTEVTAQYIQKIQSGIGDLGSSLEGAANGASSISDGAEKLRDGLGQLSNGASSAHSGAQDLSNGIVSYTKGVDSLSDGLAQLKNGSAGLGALSSGVSQFTGSIASLASALATANSNLQVNPNDPVALATVNALSSQLSAAAAGGNQLSNQVGSSLTGLAAGIAQSADGASQLAAGSSSLRTGASSLANGLSSVTDGLNSSADGASSIASGAGELASGLKAGASQIPDSASDPKAAAKIVADPVSVEVSRVNQIGGLNESLAGFLIPLGLWIGALAIFLIYRPNSQGALATGATNSRIVLSNFIRAAKISALQALALVALLHLVVGVGWVYLPATIGFSLVMALAFTAFHLALTIGFGKGGLVISILALAIQVTSTGGIYPVQLLSTPFQWLSPLLPLSYGVSGMQAIIAGGQVSTVLGSSVLLVLFGLVALLISLPIVKRIRRVRTLQALSLKAS